MDTAEYNPHKMAADALIDEIDDMDMPALIKSVPDLYEYIPDLNSVELAQVKAAFLTRAEKIGDKKLIQSIMSSCEKKIKKAERSDTIRYNREVQPAFLEFTDKGAPKESINNFLQIMLCDPHYKTVQYNLITNQAEVIRMTKDGEMLVHWSDTEDAESRNFIEQ